MHVRINESGKNKFSFRVDHFRAFRRSDVSVNARDGFVFAEDVRDVAFAGGYNFTIFDQETHIDSF